MKGFWLYLFYMLASVIIAPSIITALYTGGEFATEETDGRIDFSQWADTPEDFAVETYVKGVVAAEMPALFELEALKAQAVAARTYWFRHREEISGEAELAGQAYITEEEMQARWGDNFDAYYNRISQAVESTRGQIIKYEDDAIEAVFHAMSAGVTENSGDVWQMQMPYLVSVNSSFDADAPGFEESIYFSKEELCERFHIEGTLGSIEITGYTDAGYVRSVAVNGTEIKGSDFRSILGLKSANFQVVQTENGVMITTKGYGHGAGMSQYGANYLAGQGYGYEEIIAYYYSGVYLDYY